MPGLTLVNCVKRNVNSRPDHILNGMRRSWLRWRICLIVDTSNFTELRSITVIWSINIHEKLRKLIEECPTTRWCTALIKENDQTKYWTNTYANIDYAENVNLNRESFQIFLIKYLYHTVFLSIFVTTSALRYSRSWKSAPHLSYIVTTDNMLFFVPLIADGALSSGVSTKYDIKFPQIWPV